MEQKKSTWNYLWYALYAFSGLGLEIVLLTLLEPMLFGGISNNNYSDMQIIIHWLLTILCWGTVSILLVRNAKKRLSFDVISKMKPTNKGIIISAILVFLCIVLNALDWGTLKIVGEFQKKGAFLFTFQYIYYLFEVVLVFLIVAFGQKFFESITKIKNSIPWGGLLLSCTWGAVHFLTKGNVSDGVGVMIFAILFGIIYLLLKRNSKYSYLAMAIAFMI